ncbi:MAG TPA: glycosyltransferase [Gemmatimonadaceae bacterium]|nr:glycosyltransferase [Gemmatimonadaceae bacterium]
MTLPLSVVVPTCRRDLLLIRCLAALDAQDYPAVAYEVIVVDDGACDATRRTVWCWSLRSRATLRYTRTLRGRGPAAARNTGWRAARGEIIAFTDDDCIPTPGWLCAGVAALRGNVAGASGPIRVPLPDAPTDYERDVAGLERAEFATANCFYRRAVLAELGGFDERFAAAWREDSDLFLELLKRGHRLARAPRAVVVHPVRPERWGVSLRQQRKTMYNALLYKKHRALYWQRIQHSPPWRYYGIVAALLVGVAAATLGRRGAALAALSAWLLLTAALCLRRLRATSRAPAHVAEMVVTSALIPPLAVFWRLRGAIKYRVPFL